MRHSKETLTHLGSTGIIYRAENPTEVFLEMKGDFYPIKAFRRHLCLIGGNRRSNDRNTQETFLREFQEEISFAEAEEDLVELYAIFGITESVPTITRNLMLTEKDRRNLEQLKCRVMEETRAYRDCLLVVPETVLRQADSTYKSGDLRVLLSYSLVPLDEETWQILTALQAKFKNLSNESLSCLLNINVIIEQGLKIFPGHDQTLQQFWKECGLEQAKDIPLFEGASLQNHGAPLASYEEYLKFYDGLIKPN